MRSMGLEHLDDLELQCEAEAGHERLSWKYRFFHQRIRLGEVASAVRSSDAMICLNGADKRFASSHGWQRESRIFMTGGGVGEDLFDVRPSLGQSGGDFNVLWWGSWISRKGIAYFPDAIAQAFREFGPFRLTLGGTGCTTEQLRPFFAPEVREHLTVLPHVSRSEQLQILEQHDCFVSASLSEGFGLAILEAMAAGLPVVVTPTGIGEDLIVNGVNGLIAAKRNPIALAQGIVSLGQSIPLRRRIGAEARATALRHTWVAVAQRTLDAYDAAHR